MNIEVKKNLIKNWKDSGINERDIVLIHSSLKQLFRFYLKQKIKLTANDILDSLLSTVGSQGTLLFPLFNFDFTSGVPFDLRTTPSQMGALSEAARIHPDAVRTGHPIYSFAAIGAQSHLFDGLTNYSGYGKDSPFGILKDLNGKIAVLNLAEQNSMTFYHYVEQTLQVPYRCYKVFSGKYVNKAGKESIREFELFVRNIEQGVETDVNNMGEKLWRLGLYKGKRSGEGFSCRVINTNDIYNTTAKVIHDGHAEGYLYSIKR